MATVYHGIIGTSMLGAILPYLMKNPKDKVALAIAAISVVLIVDHLTYLATGKSPITKYVYGL